VASRGSPLSTGARQQLAQGLGSGAEIQGEPRRWLTSASPLAYRNLQLCLPLPSAREALACLETAEALGWVGPLEPELGALFQQVIGTLVRLCEPRR